jgi:hypothetical protein
MLLLSTLQQFDIDPASFFMLLATTGLILFFLLAALAAPLLAVATESIYALRNRSFYDKCALQITQTAFGASFIFLMFASGLVMLPSIAMIAPELLALATTAPPPGEEAGLFARLWKYLGPLIFFLPLLKGIILLCAYWGTWAMLKKHRALHLFLGWAAALSMLGTLFCSLLLIRSAQSPLLPVLWSSNALPTLLADFFSSPFMPLIYLGLACTGLATGAGLSQLWLFMRRFKVDHGRDYYAFAMRYCARAALAFTLASSLIYGAISLLLRYSIPPELTQPQDIGVTALAFGLPFSCCLLWFSIAKSENPLRHKPSAFFACVFLFIAICAQLLMLTTTFPIN